MQLLLPHVLCSPDLLVCRSRKICSVYLSTTFFCTLSKTYYEFAVLKDVHCPCLSVEKTDLLKIPVQFGFSEPVLISSILDKLAQKLFQLSLGLFHWEINSNYTTLCKNYSLAHSVKAKLSAF
jgi:hypothetical protein